MCTMDVEGVSGRVVALCVEHWGNLSCCLWCFLDINQMHVETAFGIWEKKAASNSKFHDAS